MAKKKRPALSELEQKIMHVVWESEAGEMTADQIRTKLKKANPMKDSTARTVLRRLEDKGYLKHTLDGRTFVYQPAIERPNVATEAVLGIVDRYCSGSIEKLLIGMVDNQALSPKQLKQLAEKIAKAEAAGNSRKPRTK